MSESLDAVEAVARAVQDANAYMPGILNAGEVHCIAQAALAAARPFIAAECAKAALDARDAWAKLGDSIVVQSHVAAAETIFERIKETIR